MIDPDVNQRFAEMDAARAREKLSGARLAMGPVSDAECYEMMADGVLPRDERGRAFIAGTEASTYQELRAATVALRDAELAMRAAQERYKNALTAHNRVIAPTEP